MVTRFYRYTLTLGAPLLVTRIEGDVSSALTAHFIPGSMIRGAVAARMDPQDPAFHTLALSGKVCYLNCYPRSAAGHRSIPVPASLRRVKYGGATERYHDLAGYAGKTEWPDEELESAPAEFLTMDQPELKWVKVATTLKVHHQRDRRLGRATRYAGALFSYESINPGQQFGGCVAIQGLDTDEVQEWFARLADLMKGTILLGRSRCAEYGGLATVSWSETEGRDRELAPLGRLIDRDVSAGERFRAVLTSDYLGRRGDTGLVDPTVIAEDLRRSLGPAAAEIKGQYLSFRRAGGFNRKWRLPVPQVSALAAGSAVVLEAKQDIPLERVIAAEHEPLGERTIECYGRVSFLYGTDPCPLIVRDEHTGSALGPTGTPPVLIQQIERRLLHGAFANEVYGIARSIDVSDPPSRSLIGRLRAALRLPAGQALDQFRVWLNDRDDDPMALRRAAKNQLKGCRVKWPDGEASMYDWLKTCAGSNGGEVADEGWFERRLRIDALSRECAVSNGSSARSLAMTLLPEMRRLLLDAVLAQVARTSKRG
ncbi:MAG: hypothetical protein AB1700_05370 [Bacillota bacterium]